MKCPYCGNDEDKVIDSRPFEDGSAIRRRRECTVCQSRYNTLEVAEMTPIFVIKKDGRKESFERSKLMNGLIRACTKRPITVAQLEQIASDIERTAQGNPNSEIESQIIGDMVLSHLKKLDEVSYIRFASVYRDFIGIDSFLKEIETVSDDN